MNDPPEATSHLDGPATDLSQRWVVLAVVCVAMLMNALDTSIVNVALPSVQRGLHFSQAGLTWVVDAYLISFGSFLLLAGRLGDLVGRKKVFLAGVATFTLASIACGAATDQAMLVSARFVQGVGGALSSSVIVAIIVTEFPEPAERAKAMSTYVFVAIGGGSIGLIAGGFLTQAVTWRSIFFINVPIGVATLIAGRLLVVENVGLGMREGLDVTGCVVVTVGVMATIYAMVTAATDGWTSAHSATFGGAGVALLAFFVLLESRVHNPIMPLRILRIPSLAGSSVIRGLVVVGLFATFFIGALYFEHVLGYGPIRTGLAFAPQTAGMATMSAGVSARLVNRFGPSPVLYAGVALAASGLALFACAGPHTAYFPMIFVAFLVLGVGAGASLMPLLQIGMSEVPAADAGLGSGIVNVSQQLAAALGLAALSTIAAGRTRGLLASGHGAAEALVTGYRTALVIAAACAALGLVLAPLLTRSPATPGPGGPGPSDLEPVGGHDHLIV